MEKVHYHSPAEEGWNRYKLHKLLTSYTLPFLGKIIEKAMLSQFNRYSWKTKCPTIISAYKEGCSTEMVLPDVSDDILMNMDRQSVTSVVCKDLSAAFNTVNLEHNDGCGLEVSYGVKGQCLKLV